MKTFLRPAFVVLLVLSATGALGVSGTTQAAATVKSWPYPIPCRIQDTGNPDLFVMILGDVSTPLSQGLYDPRTDEATLRDGTVKKGLFKDALGVKFFTPLDKKIFPLPPSGFCTWYYYYQDVNENEVKWNAEWMAENLKDYGARYVQIDDGWQGETKEGRHGSRDWTTVDKAFPGGMAALAARIRALGFVPGIWLAPHGQSNEDVVKASPGVFLFKPDGTSASQSWEGPFLVDPSTPATHAYLKDMFSKLAGWGYDYYKIDGQPVVLGEFAKTAAVMKNPGDTVALYRKTLDTIRAAIGPNRFLLGCWGTPLEGVGIMNGSRTGGDVVLGWSGGFMVALRATLRWYFTHNIAWYADPDTMLLRPPLTLDQARAWATLQGLTGQALMSSDRLMDLSRDRVEIMRRVYPAVDIRPLDLFPAQRNKRIWDLKVSHLGRNYDVVGVFNYGESKAEQVELKWADLGIPDDKPVQVFDFWGGEYVGAWEAGMAIDLAPTSCRVLTLVPMTEQIQLISTNRHITQGWVDLAQFAASADGMSFTGRSRVIKNDPYELSFAFPRGKNFAVKKATARGPKGVLATGAANHQGWATVRIEPTATVEVDWEVSFEAAPSYVFPTASPTGLRVERVGLDGVDFKWGAQYYLNVGYQVLLDGKIQGYAGSTAFPFRGLDPLREYTAEVRSVWEDGSVGERHKPAELKFSLLPLVPEDLALNSIDPLPAAAGGGRMGFGGPRPILARGQRHEAAIAVSGGAESAYDVKGLFQGFTASVAVDDSAPDAAKLEFIVLGDGKEVWRSGPLGKSDPPKSVVAKIEGVRRLGLKVVVVDAGTPPAAGQAQGQGMGRPRSVQGDWLVPFLAGKIKPGGK